MLISSEDVGLLVDKVIIFFIAPLGTALCAAILSFVLLWLGRSKLSAWLGTFALAWLLLWSLPPVAASLARVVEAPYQPPLLEDIPVSAAIVVLGGGMSASRHEETTGQTIELSEASERVWFASRLFHAGKAPLLMMSGGRATNLEPFSEAFAMSLLAMDLGVPESALMLEYSSTNTRENARFTASVLHKLQVNNIILVTSAAHMARAVHHFEEQGMVVFPAPTDYATNRLTRKVCCLPDADALAASGQLLKEVLGQMVWR